MKKLAEYLKPYNIWIMLSVVMAAISVMASLVLPVLVGRAIDAMMAKRDLAPFMGTLFLMLVFIAVGFVSQMIMGRINIRIQTRVVRRLRMEAFASISRLPVSEVDRMPHGDLQSRIISDADAVGDGLLLGFSQLFTGVMTIVGTIVLLFRISIRIAPVVVLLTPLSLFVAKFISSKSNVFFREQAKLRGQINDFAQERIGSQKLIAAFGATTKSKEEFGPINDELTKTSLKATFYSSLPNPSSRFVNNLIYMAVGVLGALDCIGGGISVGGLTSFLSYAGSYAKPFNEITGVITEMQNAFVCAGRLFELIEMEPEEDAENCEMASARGDIVFENVDFSYDKEKKLIENLNLSVKRGEHIAIVGPTGAGKTTIVNLLMRFYDVDKGKITIDKKDISTVTHDSLRKSYGMVLQETWLRNGTIYENIVLGREDATIEEVTEAARKTKAHEFIRKLPDGYNTMIEGDKGVLSQGQKQLICITRVMLSLPPMMILDEATSSIDTRTEMKIQGAFRQMMAGRTTFIVAHRLSTIRNCDQILYMEQGKILEQGTHDELLTENGRYARLYNVK